MSILQDIYNADYAPSKPLPKALCDKQWEFYGEVERVMGLEFMEAHWDTLCEIEHYRDMLNFQEGFRLGVALMLELL